MSQSPHDKFLGLCAVSTSGQLTDEERKRLEQHLVVCPSCRDAMKQFDAVVRKTIPALAPDPKEVEFDPLWSQEQAESALFERLTREEDSGTNRGSSDWHAIPKALGRVPLSASQTTWRNVSVLGAAGVLLCIAFAVSAYQVGIRRGVNTASSAPVPDQSESVSLLEQAMSDAGHEREVLRSQVGQRDKEIVWLRHELERTKVAQRQTENELQSAWADKQIALQQRSEFTENLEGVRAKAQELQARLDLLERELSQDKERGAVLTAKLADYTRLLQDREATIDQQQELLAHDRDIRDLMGARDLYVAEVYDVERTGETRKPYGRVFYTKGKSLIFYAYDLDRQSGVRNASIFQAWGRRGPDWQQALNLGMFYVDSASKKRWVLRFDNPVVLAQIDAVFVTVEPTGGSHKPSNKPLLFAYLHIDPNHP